MIRAGALAALLLVAGCYAPSFVTGTPCDPAIDNCPTGQICTPSRDGYVCDVEAQLDSGAIDVPAIDAAIDGPPSNDNDGDGIVNASDNCPSVANADQANEDADPRGDRCDECPPLASMAVLDGDGDGVGDACDPNPLTTGDRITLFEGFAAGIPATWAATGNWTASAGNAVVTAATTDLATLVIPMIGSVRQSLATDATITALSQTTGGSLGVVDQFNVTGTAGILCGAARSSTPVFGTVNAANGTFIDTVPGSFDVGDRFQIRFQRRTDTYTCSSTGTPSATVTSTATLAGAGTLIGLRARIASATFRWVMLISSP